MSSISGIQVYGYDLDPFSRYQNGLAVVHLYPLRYDGLCACGCGKKLTGRRKRWATNLCSKSCLDKLLVIKGDTQHIRCLLYGRDHGVCAACGDCEKWHADHILPVEYGGGACTLDNFQTLCTDCHKIKTAYQAQYGAKCATMEIRKVKQLKLI